MERARSAEAKWYVVHTRTGYENKVKTDLEKTVLKLLKKMVKPDSEFITVIYGSDVTETQAAEIEAKIQAKFGQKAEITMINGGQPIYYYILSVE